MKRRVQTKTLVRKGKELQNILGLQNWNITFRFVHQSKMDDSKDEQCSAKVYYISESEKTAIIHISTTYYKHKGYGISWDLNSLLLHELIHLVLWDRMLMLPDKILKTKRMKDFEEWIADCFAHIIANLINKKSAKK